MKRWALATLLLGFCGAVSAAEPMRVSVNQGTHTFVPADSFGPSLSADGHLVTFESQARLTIDDKNRVRDIYYFNTKTQLIKMVPAPSKVRLNSGPSLSRDGNWIAFHSYSSTKFPSKYPRTSDIYLFNVENGEVSALFPATRTELYGGEALFPEMSHNNNIVLFTASSDALVRQVYTADRESGELLRVSRSPEGAAGNRPSGLAHFSANGGVVVFMSASTNLGEGLPLTSLSTHLYRARLEDGQIERLDKFERGIDPREWMIGTFDISDDAGIVVYEAHHRSTDPYATLASSDLFVYDRDADKSMLITDGLFSGVSRNPRVNGDGRFVVFTLNSKKQPGIVVYSRADKAWKQVVEGEMDNAVISKNGCVIAYESLHKKIRDVFVIRNPFLETEHACD